ncbi:MAG: BrnT family toxin [Pseudomonadales bacterium]|nr:BrnT family toxin [Pseudomonadales bacterium]
MKPINWNSTKNQQLIAERGISFEDIVFYLQQGLLLDDIEHTNSNKYPEQPIFVIEVDGYVYFVPYIEDRKEIFLKTVIPSRKTTKQYLRDEK